MMTRRGSLLLTAVVLVLLGGALLWRSEPSVDSPSPAGPTPALSKTPVEERIAGDSRGPSRDSADAPVRIGEAAPSGSNPEVPGLRITSRPDELVDEDGTLSYNGRDYLLSADRSGLHAELPLGAPDSNRPRLTLALDDVRVGTSRLDLRSEASPVRDAGKALSFDRGGLRERVTCGPRDFEQDFVLSSLPEARGAITVTERIGTRLSPPPEGTSGSSLQFGTEESGAFLISKAAALDAAGRKLPLDLTYRDGRIEMTVPEAWVRDAELPIVIDPVIGSPFSIYSGLSYQGTEQFNVAYGSGPNEWLVTWWDQIGSSASKVYGQRVSAAGALSGSTFQISTATFAGYVGVAYSPSTNSYLVVYVNHLTTTSTYSLVGRFVSATGTMPAAEFVISSNTSGFANPSVATDGTGTFYVVTENAAPVTGGYRALSGFLLSNTGSLLASGAPQPAAAPFPQIPRVAYSSPEYMVTWNEGSNMLARGMNTAGTFLTPITTVATNSSGPVSVSAGGGKFLYTWTAGTSGTAVQGMIAQAGGGSSISFTTGAFTVSSGSVDSYPYASYSGTAGQWFVAHQYASGTLSANLVSPTGAAGSDQAVSPASSSLPRTAWNSTTGDVLVVYEWWSPSGSATTYINAVRFNLSNPPPAVTLSGAPGDSQVSLTWSTSTGATSYKVFRANASSGYNYLTPLTTVTSTSFVDMGVTNGTAYFYVVRASGPGGDSGNSNEVSVTPIAPPPPPTGLLAVPGNLKVSLSWAASAGAVSYQVFHSTSSGVYGPSPIASNITTTSYVDTAVTNGTPWYFVVRAVNSGGAVSGPSNEASAMPNPALAAPTGFSGTAKSTTSILWQWAVVSGATGYQLRDTEENVLGNAGTGVTTFTETLDLNENVPATRHVNAMNGGVPSADSSPATVYTLVHAPVSGDFSLKVVLSSRIDVTVTPPPNEDAGSTACEISRSPDGTTWTVLKTFSTAGYSASDTGLAPSTKVSYRFRFQNGNAVATAFSPVKSATTGAAGAAAPSAALNIRVTAYASAVDIEWDPSPSANVAGYNVYRRIPGAAWPTLPLNQTSPLNGLVGTTKFRDTTVAPNTAYQYQVTAVAP